MAVRLEQKLTKWDKELLGLDVIEKQYNNDIIFYDFDIEYKDVDGEVYEYHIWKVKMDCRKSKFVSFYHYMHEREGCTNVTESDGKKDLTAPYSYNNRGFYNVVVSICKTTDDPTFKRRLDIDKIWVQQKN